MKSPLAVDFPEFPCNIVAAPAALLALADLAGRQCDGEGTPVSALASNSYTEIVRLTPTRENYLRALYQLARSGGGVRLTDLARMQGVRLPTARHAVDCLRDAGLVLQESYGLISLTESGRQRGKQLCERFELTRKFLIEVLGIGEGTAEREACLMEHHLDADTLDRIAAFVVRAASGVGTKRLKDASTA